MGLIEFWVQTKGTERTAERLEIMISHTKVAMEKVDEDTASVLDDVVDFLGRNSEKGISRGTLEAACVRVRIKGVFITR